MADRWGIDWNEIARLTRVDITALTKAADVLAAVEIPNLSAAAKLLAEQTDLSGPRRIMEEANRQLIAASALDSRRLLEATRVDWAAIARAAELTPAAALLDTRKELLSALAVQPIPRLIDREMLELSFSPVLVAAQELARQSLADRAELQATLQRFADITADIDLAGLGLEIDWTDDDIDDLGDRVSLLELVPDDLRTGNVKVDLLIGAYVYLGVVIYLVVGVPGIIGQVLFTAMGKLWETLQIALAEEKKQDE